MDVVLPRIEGKVLMQSDIGRHVVYVALDGERQPGVLSSFREDGAIFVRFKGQTGERCSPEQLRWVFGETRGSK